MGRKALVWGKGELWDRENLIYTGFVSDQNRHIVKRCLTDIGFGSVGQESLGPRDNPMRSISTSVEK